VCCISRRPEPTSSKYLSLSWFGEITGRIQPTFVQSAARRWPHSIMALYHSGWMRRDRRSARYKEASLAYINQLTQHCHQTHRRNALIQGGWPSAGIRNSHLPNTTHIWDWGVSARKRAVTTSVTNIRTGTQKKRKKRSKNMVKINAWMTD
jgi:hypothetical protein